MTDPADIIGRDEESPVSHPIEKIARRFWERTDKRDAASCWAWTGSKLRADRGTLWCGNKNVIASRISWRLRHGDWPPGTVFVCHSCDNPNCVNPDHLWLGTNAENIRDSVSKGRQWTQRHPEDSFFAKPESFHLRPRGSRHGLAKLNDEKVAEILRLQGAGTSDREISSRYGIHISTSGYIRSGRLWKHVPRPTEARSK